MDRAEARDWARNEFGSAVLGDQRRTARLVAMATEACLRPGGRVSQVFLGGAARQGAYDFLESPKTRVQAIARSAQEATARRAAEHDYVFVAVDGTSLTLVDRVGAKDFGKVGAHDRRGRGLKVVDAIAVAPDGVPLGIAAFQWWARGPRLSYSHCRKPSDRETQRWIDAVHDISCTFERHASRTKAWFQIDREGDAWRMLSALSESGHLFTVRSNGTRQLLHSQKTLRPYVARRPALGHALVEVPASRRRAARLATVAYRACRLTLKMYDDWTKRRIPLDVNVVHVREASRVPHGEKPLDWLLITNAPIDTVADIERVVFGYTQRWRVEDFHRTWKDGGCHVEDTQLRRRAHVIAWATVLAAVAARIERLKHLAREHADRPASDELSAAEIRALILLKRSFKKKTETIPDTMPTIADATLWLAELGGYTGKSSGGPPGSITIGRGLDRLRTAATMVEILAAEEKSKKKR